MMWICYHHLSSLQHKTKPEIGKSEAPELSLLGGVAKAEARNRGVLAPNWTVTRTDLVGNFNLIGGEEETEKLLLLQQSTAATPPSPLVS